MIFKNLAMFLILSSLLCSEAKAKNVYCPDQSVLKRVALQDNSDSLWQNTSWENLGDYGALRAKIDDLLVWYQNHGFVFAQIKIHHQNCAPMVAVELHKGEAWLWDYAQSQNNVGVKPENLSKMALIKRGEPANLASLEASRRLLARRAYFHVGDSVQLFRQADRNLLIPVFDLESRAHSSVEGFFMYAQDDFEKKWQSWLRLDLRNIGGAGRDFSLWGRQLDDTRELQLHWLEWALFSTHLDLNLDLHIEADSVENHWGFHGALGWQYDYNWHFSMGYLARTMEKTRASQGGEVSVVYDSRDQVPLTRSGLRWESQNQWWQRPNGANKGYFSTHWRGELYYPLAQSLSAKLDLRYQTLWPRKNNYNSRELFKLGGEILPGYWPNSILSPQFALLNVSLHKYFSQTALGAFAEIACLRTLNPGLDLLWDYGVSLEQNQRGITVFMQIAWARESSFLEALLSLGVRTNF
ncbi:MAG: BamA/TamA family outer membrane protein [Fibrobacter sp.]|nr:BamA/TamA family outer membrane protein [Fibrobacter sp.]